MTTTASDEKNTRPRRESVPKLVDWIRSGAFKVAVVVKIVEKRFPNVSLSGALIFFQI
jgi:hypothetical protein